MKKLYETNSYLTQNDTTITSYECREGRHFITLDETIFFPNEGGQYADTGKLIIGSDTINLIDGNINGDEIIYEISAPIQSGTSVHCVLDWDIRFSKMQQHSAEHIMCGIVHELYGYDNVGFHLSDDEPITFDIDGVITDEQIRDLEKRANFVITSNQPIKDSYPTKDELKDISYRSKIEIEGQVRLITIGSIDSPVDICACCAPHVRTTGEIGLVKIVNYVNWKGGIRFYMLAGRRAFEYLSKEHDILKELSRSFSTNIDDVSQKIFDMRDEALSCKSAYNQLIENDLLSQISNMTADDIPCIFLSEIHGAFMKSAYNSLCEKYDSFVGVFLGNDDEGYRYFAGSTKKDSLLLKSVFTEKLDAKGGGKSDMIQGKINKTQAEIARVFKELI